MISPHFLLLLLPYVTSPIFHIQGTHQGDEDTIDPRNIYNLSSSYLQYIQNNSFIFNFTSSSSSSSSSSSTYSPINTIGRGINGGFPCAACTVLLGISEQLADINNSSLYSGLDTLCSFLPTELGSQCSILVHVFGPDIIEFFNYGSSPDQICYQIGICYDEVGKGMCHLFPLAHEDEGQIETTEMELHWPHLLAAKSVDTVISSIFPWLCYIPGVKQLCEALDRAFNRLVPGLDVDGDGHSPAEGLRGSLWRGRDCHDGDPDIHPGARPWSGDIMVDTNCNGIQGINPRTGLSWEEELCGGSGAQGLVYLGDSVGGHFHLPAQWFSPLEMDSNIFANITEVVSNEGDWPHLSFATGFRNSTMPEIISGRIDSLYLRMRERNRCNHRDYHNLARNGADSFSTLDYLKALSRTTRDLPALVFYGLIGNDVCRMIPGNMTTPVQFRANTLQVLEYLEDRLAPGSHVVLVGLIDAAFLYKAMANRYHPLGKYRKNVKYKDVYSWFNCMEIGPCSGWMTQDQGEWVKTSKRARQLTNVLRELAASARYTKFDLAFLENPFSVVLDNWVAGGGEVHQLVEPVDSLHPTQAAQALITEQVWTTLEQRWPHFLGPINPHNQRIIQMFGDQGGH